LVPSVGHTARAVVALQRWAHVGGEGAATRPAVNQAVDWLVTVGKLENTTEHIRRRIGPAALESLIAQHFTAVWVARALMGTTTPRTPAATRLLTTAVDTVRRYQTDGMWAWDDGSNPLWMTYQGITVLRDHALQQTAAH
jgi:hypothetical protein